MLRRYRFVALVALTAAALGACDEPPDGAFWGTGGTMGAGGSGIVLGTGGSAIVGDGPGFLKDQPLFDVGSCTVPERFQLAHYAEGLGGAGGVGGAAGGENAGGAAGEGAILDPGTLEVGDGDLSVLLVFDKSGSMGRGWGDRSRFWAAHDALMRGVHQYVRNLTLAAIMFPVDTNCGVASLESQRQITWLQGYDFVDRWYADICRNQPNGGTPLYAALQVADTTIQKAQSLGLLEDRFRVVVLTDGEETCDPTNDPTEFPAAWAKLGVETSVIGLPGSEEADAVLREIARVGGGSYTPLPSTGNPEDGQGTLNGALDSLLK